VSDTTEGSPVTVPSQSDEFRLSGQVGGSPPFRGTLVHPGWKATRCDVPVWTGQTAARDIIAPAEVEVT